MTKSAKQDATRPAAEPAETESAATGSAATGGEATPQPEGTAETAAVASAEGEPGQAGPAEVPDLDETKRKFREALERKNQAHSEGQGKGGRDAGKISGAHGPAASRRNFRRKSG